MATYINELRAFIASTSTSSASDGAEPGSAHLEVKLREVLPNLLRDYVVTSPKGAPPFSPPPSTFISRGPRLA